MTDSVGGAIRRGAAALREAGIDDPRGDARRLLAAAMAVPPDRLSLGERDPVPAAAAQRYDAFLGERAARRPVAQITGERWFFRHRFRITSDVLDPRPETETLVARALETPFTRILDLGTGSGCILLSLLAEQPAATGLGTDISPAALAVAAENAARTGLSDRAAFREASWFDGIGGRFDLIVANPPYIAQAEMPDLAPEVRDWEPRAALTDGGDGLSSYRAIAAGAGRHLRPGGRLIVEIGPTQGAVVAEMLATAGLAPVSVHRDLDGRDRVVEGWSDPSGR